MRSVRREPPLRSDPAPSRAAYRVTRLWLSPLFRLTVKVLLPLAVAGGLAGVWIVQSDQRDRLAGWIAEIQAKVKTRPEVTMRQMIITGAAPELSREIREALPVKFPVSWFDLDTEALLAVVDPSTRSKRRRSPWIWGAPCASRSPSGCRRSCGGRRGASRCWTRPGTAWR